jgi:hypothetical protein
VFPIIEYELQYRLSLQDAAAAATADDAGTWLSALDAQSKARAVKYCAHTIDSLQPNQQYTFRLRAANTIGWGPFGAASAPIRTRAAKADAPGSPTLVAAAAPATPLPAGPISLLLRWDAPVSLGGCGVCGFEVQWAEQQLEPHWQALCALRTRMPARVHACVAWSYAWQARDASLYRFPCSGPFD